ncbi:MAG: AbrB family transcriptional regulator [Acidobacteriota bacterium]|nr:AbrB family transcriptional regulator [Acidobacteriota bacterium]
MARPGACGQTTSPERIRAGSRPRQGDTPAIAVPGKERQFRKAPATADEYLRAVRETLQEWNSKEDETAWRDL